MRLLQGAHHGLRRIRSRIAAEMHGVVAASDGRGVSLRVARALRIRIRRIDRHPGRAAGRRIGRTRERQFARSMPVSGVAGMFRGTSAAPLSGAGP